MRCYALTHERRRCPAEAENPGLYCAPHAAQMQEGLPQDDPFPPGNGKDPRGSWVKRLRGQSDRGQVPDQARFGVPSYLSSSPTPKVIHYLRQDPNPNVRWMAAFTLRKRRETAAIEPLWQALHHETARLVRQQSAVALGKIGTPAALGPLLEALWHDPDPGVRQACAVAIGNLGIAHAAGDLVHILGREENEFVRWDCILALGRLGDRTTAPLLRQLASSERAHAVRQACLEALADIERRG